MCKSKKSTEVTEPNAISRSSRTPRPSKPSSSETYRSSRSQPSKSEASSSTGPSSSNIVSENYTTGSSYKDSSKTSTSSKASLSSLKDSLPEKPHVYDFTEIRNATNSFLAKRYSSSAAAWRCSIRGKDVIVYQRKLRRSIETSQLGEQLSLICRSHHTSLIKLLGASISGDHIYLVYDFVTGANLADCLRNPKNPTFTVLSTWLSRMQVASDLAQGLDYMHNSIGTFRTLVHNHIKSTSIIITEPSFNAKICHFATAELCGEIPQDHPKEKSSEITEITEASSSSSSKLKRADSRIMKFEGATGYISPEFQSTGVGTQKSDVYAFGVVLLELLSGEEPLKFKLDKEKGNYRKISVMETAREAMTEPSGGGGGGGGEGSGGGVEGGLRRWVDRRLKDSFPVDVAEKLTRLALDCVHVDPDKRPDIRDVAGKISKLYLKSMKWANQMKVPTDFTVSFAPR